MIMSETSRLAGADSTAFQLEIHDDGVVNIEVFHVVDKPEVEWLNFLKFTADITNGI